MGSRTIPDRYGNQVTLRYDWNAEAQELTYRAEAIAAPGWASLCWVCDAGLIWTSEAIRFGGSGKVPSEQLRAEYPYRISTLQAAPYGEHDFLRLPGTAYPAQRFNLQIDRVLQGSHEGAVLAYRETEPCLWLEMRGDYAQLKDKDGLHWVGPPDLDTAAATAREWIAKANQG